MTTSSFLKNTLWVGSEFLKIFYTPVGVAGGFIDAFRGWKFSRSWVRVWFHLPSLILLLGVYIVFFFSFFSRVDSRIQLFSVESEKQIPTKTLEAICNSLFEDDFCKAIDWVTAEKVETKMDAVSDLKHRYVELLSKRVLTKQPTNQAAHYRLGMIHMLTGQSDAAVSEMSELAKGQFGDCPQANAWMAKDILKRSVAGTGFSAPELTYHLEKATKWKEVDFRLISFYAKMLEKMGENDKAVSVARQAANFRPELQLELARVLQRIGSKEEAKSAANIAEDIFIKRLNAPTEKESDRIAVAEARVMTDRLEQAAEILTEGLQTKTSGPATKRELSEIQRLIYRRSIVKTDEGEYSADVSLLEKAAESDPLNANISTEIANMLRLKILPTQNLKNVLLKQLELGISSVPSHIALAEGYFVSGKVNLAIKNWELALAKDPNNLGVLNNLSLCLARESEKNAPRSLELIKKAAALAPASAEIFDTFGDILVIAKRPQEAIGKYEHAVRLELSRIETRRKLYTAYKLLGMDGQAEATSAVIKEMERAKELEEAKAKEKPPEK